MSVYALALIFLFMAALGAAGDDPAEELEQMVARHVLGGHVPGVEELQRMAALRWQSLPMCMLLCICMYGIDGAQRARRAAKGTLCPAKDGILTARAAH